MQSFIFSRILQNDMQQNVLLKVILMSVILLMVIAILLTITDKKNSYKVHSRGLYTL